MAASLLDSNESTNEAMSCILQVPFLGDKDEEASSISRNASAETLTGNENANEKGKSDKKGGQHLAMGHKKSKKVERSLARVAIVSTYEIDGITWYLVWVQEGDTEIHCMKRYSNFVALDQKLRACEVHARQVKCIPEMPDASKLGLRPMFHAFELDAKMQEALEKYLDAIVAQIPSLDSDPIVEKFLRKDTMEKQRVRDNKCHVLPTSAVCHQARHEHHVCMAIISTKRINRVTWYVIRVRQVGAEIYCMKRYNDFASLDMKLRAHANEMTWGQVHVWRVNSIPEMPEAGTFGFRQTFDVGDFNVKRLNGLQKYLDTITAQILSVASDPVVEEFICKDTMWRGSTLQRH